jgi:hypothetical protein
MGQSASSSSSRPPEQSEESAGTKHPGEDLSTTSVKRCRTKLDTPSQRRSLDTSLTDQDNPSLCAELEESRKEVDQLRLDLKDANKLAGTLSVEKRS